MRRRGQSNSRISSAISGAFGGVGVAPNDLAAMRQEGRLSAVKEQQEMIRLNEMRREDALKQAEFERQDYINKNHDSIVDSLNGIAVDDDDFHERVSELPSGIRTNPLLGRRVDDLLERRKSYESGVAASHKRMIDNRDKNISEYEDNELKYLSPEDQADYFRNKRSNPNFDLNQVRDFYGEKVDSGRMNSQILTDLKDSQDLLKASSSLKDKELSDKKSQLTFLQSQKKEALDGLRIDEKKSDDELFEEAQNDKSDSDRAKRFTELGESITTLEAEIKEGDKNQSDRNEDMVNIIDHDMERIYRKNVELLGGKRASVFSAKAKAIDELEGVSPKDKLSLHKDNNAKAEDWYNNAQSKMVGGISYVYNSPEEAVTSKNVTFADGDIPSRVRGAFIQNRNLSYKLDGDQIYLNPFNVPKRDQIKKIATRVGFFNHVGSPKNSAPDLDNDDPLSGIGTAPSEFAVISKGDSGANLSGLILAAVSGFDYEVSSDLSSRDKEYLKAIERGKYYENNDSPDEILDKLETLYKEFYTKK